MTKGQRTVAGLLAVIAVTLGPSSIVGGSPAAGDDDEGCIWDLNESGAVDVPDLLELLAAWGTDPDEPPDFDDDGVVAVPDLLELLAHWGACP